MMRLVECSLTSKLQYSDVARLLSFYQLWLDDLYPRAKFADGLAIIEKLGHHKRMQTMRKEWIREGKARHSSRTDDQEQAQNLEKTSSGLSHEGQRTSTEPNKSSGKITEDKSFRCQSNAENTPKFLPGPAASADDGLFISEDERPTDEQSEDDIDALLAEDEARQVPNAPTLQEEGGSNGRKPDEFDDEEEAMAGMDDMW